MYLRFLSPCVALLLAGAPVLAEPPKPTIVFQGQPVSRHLGDFREMVRQVAGPEQADQAVKKINEGIKEAFGEQGFEGLDTTRPIGGYVVLRDNLPDAFTVVVVPVTGEKEFVGLLERMKMKAEAVKDKKGVYKLELREGAAAEVLPKGACVQFAGPWAYVLINSEPVDAKDLVPTGDLFNNSDQSLMAARLYPDRIPEKLIKTALDQLDNTANGIKGFVGAGGLEPAVARLAKTFLEDGPKLVRRYTETVQKEATEVALHLTWDAAASSIAGDLTITPKPGTGLAKDIAANAVVTNRFAGLIPKDAAVGAIFKLPLFAPETRSIVAALLEAGQEGLKGEHSGLQKQFHPIVDEVAKGFIGSVKKGDFGGAMALAGPDKAGKFTLVTGLTLDNAPAVEKAALDLIKGRDFAKIVQLDVAKAGGVSIHKVDLLAALPERDRADIAKLFGTDAPGHVAFAKDAVFMALGSDSLDRVKAALEAKPGPGPMLDVVGNMKRLHAMVSATGGEREAADFAKIMGTDDKTISALRITVTGGDKLTVKGALNVHFLPRAAAATAAVKNPPQPVPPAAVGK